ICPCQTSICALTRCAKSCFIAIANSPFHPGRSRGHFPRVHHATLARIIRVFPAFRQDRSEVRTAASHWAARAQREAPWASQSQSEESTLGSPDCKLTNSPASAAQPFCLEAHFERQRAASCLSSSCDLLSLTICAKWRSQRCITTRTSALQSASSAARWLPRHWDAPDKIAEVGANTPMGPSWSAGQLASFYVLLAAQESSYSTRRLYAVWR